MSEITMKLLQFTNRKQLHSEYTCIHLAGVETLGELLRWCQPGSLVMEALASSNMA